MEPQFFAWAAHVVGVHPEPQTFPTPPPPQVWGDMQVPHDSVPPHPLEGEPQFFPKAAQVVGVQGVPQMLASPRPPQVCGAVQLPHESVPPQPSGIESQFFPCAAQEVGVHAQPPPSASQGEQPPARHETKPSAAQSSSRLEPSWQNFTVVPSQAARSRETEHSLPVSTQAPDSQRLKVGLRAQSERIGSPPEQLTATVPSQLGGPGVQVPVLEHVAPPSGSTVQDRPALEQSARNSPGPTQASASVPRHCVAEGQAPTSHRPTRAKKTLSSWQAPP